MKHLLTRIHKLPYVSVLFALIASATFYLCHTHDSEVWSEIDSFYASHLLKTEKLLYLDFYQKRLNIEQKGTEEQFAQLIDYIERYKNHELSRMILADRSFRQYLINKSPIYFSDKQNKQWKEDNQTLTHYLHQLSIYQFAIVPEIFSARPSISNLFTYSLVDTQFKNILSNLIIFFLLCLIAEQFLSKSLLIKALLSSILMHAGLYLSFSNILTPPLYGLNMQVYVLFSSLLLAFIRFNYPFKRVRLKASKKTACLVMGVLLFAAKVALDSYLGIFNKAFVFCFVSLLMIVFIITCLAPQFVSFKTASTKPSIQKHGSMNAALRKEYAEAMNAISRFNFKYARQQLRRLVKNHPDAVQIKESSYHLEKLVPEESNFWQLAQEGIETSLVNEDYPAMLAIFQDIQKAAPSRTSAKKHLSPEHYLKMLVIFLKQGDLEKAEHAFMFLELAGNPHIVKEACTLLIEAFSKKHNIKKQAHYSALLDNYLNRS